MDLYEAANLLGGELTEERCSICWHMPSDSVVIDRLVGNYGWHGRICNDKEPSLIYCRCCHPETPVQPPVRLQNLRQNRRPINGGKPKPVVPETPKQVAARKRAQAIEAARAKDALRRHWKEERANSA